MLISWNEFLPWSRVLQGLSLCRGGTLQFPEEVWRKWRSLKRDLGAGLGVGTCGGTAFIYQFENMQDFKSNYSCMCAYMTWMSALLPGSILYPCSWYNYIAFSIWLQTPRGYKWCALNLLANCRGKYYAFYIISAQKVFVGRILIFHYGSFWGGREEILRPWCFNRIHTQREMKSLWISFCN